MWALASQPVQHAGGETYWFTCPVACRVVLVSRLAVPEVVQVLPDAALPMGWVAGEP